MCLYFLLILFTISVLSNNKSANKANFYTTSKLCCLNNQMSLINPKKSVPMDNFFFFPINCFVLRFCFKVNSGRLFFTFVFQKTLFFSRLSLANKNFHCNKKVDLFLFFFLKKTLPKVKLGK